MRALVAVAVLLLAGCESSRFTSLPWAEGGPVCADPPSGWWVARDPDEVDAPTWVHIATDCTIALATQQTREDGSIEFETYRLAAAYGTVGPRAIFALPDRDVVAIDVDLAGQDSGSADRPVADGWHLVDVARERDSLRLRFVDHRRLAHAIIDGKIRGSVIRTETNLANTVTEDSEGVRALLADASTFGGADPVRVDRVEAARVPAEVVDSVNAASEAGR